MRRSILAGLFAGALLIANTANAALDATLRLTNAKGTMIQGGMTQKGREGNIRVTAFQHKIDAKEPGDAKHGVVTITKPVDRSSPLLYQGLVKGEVLSEFELKFWEALPSGAESNRFTIVLRKARVTSIKLIKPSTLDPALKNVPDYEEVSFSYGTIEWKHVDSGTTSASGS